ncbi:hypothetical protein GCM10011321_20830 [Youhaiella tibetensis]|uniref:Phage tail assembly chaperone n=1 Tax=Paradevosia tibetensis TaxID=1447062 RepID=A0A5B9DLF9_9HYPH|nr:rcc01693 family protein [Youhaiella tibetensis]AKR54738.1 hypothetical protein XM25_02755 [Devosia sp. H5989]QEE19856.1 phage tail assembly chaperone [Youhaiella tibetensis]GGF29308.1 hypothetical protein GCM10011321_20830 [Youhaiella tibetensis]
MKPFPWDDAMQMGFGVMRLSSREFWGLTPRELAAAFGALSGPATAPPRERLDEMMLAFPDRGRS